ncbi:NACHT, LRR and PYD domains-containing protein 1 homolog [Engraulis encrasicolus]|uniref:NACHT, LRR and PYD domains-containing protein 1 homolog n=1 Tax=Engraulis encrasicolus TaxID=184585 RepID=UPI002FD01781
MLKLKEWICKQNEIVKEYNALPDDEVLLTSRYTQLLIIEKTRQRMEKEKEIRFGGPGYFGAISSEHESTTVEQFFEPNDRGRIPQAVILQGNSGHGKSFTAQKILLDWASGKLYQDKFQLVSHLSCKELNLIYKEQRSVVDLLSCSQTFNPLVLKKLKNSPQKVLLLIDGFDELQFAVPEIRKCPVKDVSTEAPVQTILGALLTGSILSECFLLVTTRPTASDKLSKLLKHPVRCTEILGFSEEGVHEYIRGFCEDEEVVKETLRRVKANETLFSSCFIPVICWIVCTVFRVHLSKNIEQTDSVETTTSIFVDFVSILLKHHRRGLEHPVLDVMRSLGQLAEKGIQEQQVLFDKEIVERIVSDPANIPFLCKFLLKETVEMKEMFSFMHLSFQEFFTALHYALAQDEEKVKELLQSIEHDEGRSHRVPVIQFLFGLSEVKTKENLKKLGMAHDACMEAHLKEWVVKLINEDPKKKHMMLFTLHCLYELHDKEFVRSAMEVWGEVSFEDITLTRTDCWVLLYCLQCCSTIPGLQLMRCNITPDKLRMLQPELNRCQELEVGSSSLSDESVQQILTAVSKQESVGRVGFQLKTITLTTARILLNFMNSTQTVQLVA